MKVVVALSVVSVCAAVPFKKRNALTALAIAAVSTANVAGVDLVIPKLSKAVTNENWIESQEDTRVTDEKSFWGICRDTASCGDLSIKFEQTNQPTETTDFVKIAIQEMLSMTYQDEEAVTITFGFNRFSTLSKGHSPQGIFHLDNCHGWVKSDSTTQQRNPETPKDALEFFQNILAIRNMKMGQAIAIIGDKLYRGSPVLEYPLDGDRDAMVITVKLKQKPLVWSSLGILLLLHGRFI